MAEALIKLRKLYNLPVQIYMVKKKVIPATKKLGKELLKTASLDYKLRVCAYVRVHAINK